MIGQPIVCAVCLTANRPEMLKRAVRSFYGQTYENKRLLILDTGKEPNVGRGGATHIWLCDEGLSIGLLRNTANAWTTGTEILIHWDDDDVSHPNRIAEQVALLQSSGADIVGYLDMLFWRSPRGCDPGASPKGCDMASHAPGEHDGEAYLYTSSNPNYCIGTSLCYWRKTWERRPFPDKTRGEDTDWQRSFKRRAVSSIDPRAPRLIASIHAGNAKHYLPEIESTAQHRAYARVPQWDEYCRRAMAMETTEVRA